MVEATAVLPTGRITPEDTGLWRDSHVAPLRRLADFVHSQGHKVGIQLNHAGRKAGTLAPWLRRPGLQAAPSDAGGWPDDIWGPSPIPFSDAYPKVKEMSREQIAEVVDAFAAAARRAVDAGVDVIEVHGAHGYLLNQFLSPLANVRDNRRARVEGGHLRDERC